MPVNRDDVSAAMGHSDGMTSTIGTPINPVEGIEKVTRRATYTADVVVAGLTHAVLVQSEFAHGGTR